MEPRNNNREVIRTLSKVTYKNSKGRNRLMIGAVALAVILIFTMASIVVGRYDAEYLMSARDSGSVASSSLESPSEEQVEKIKSLPYIKTTGMEWAFGTIDREGNLLAYCSAMSEETFNEMYAPAFTDIEGHYPGSENEVLLPTLTLEMLGIENPELDQPIELTIQISDNEYVDRTFTLAGTYKGYKAHDMPSSFFSTEILKTLDINKDIGAILLMKQSDPMSGYVVEDKLYEDVETVDDVQQFSGGASVNYYVVQNMAGSYQMAIACLLLIMLCVYLLITNVMSISLNRDVRHFGLLKTIGTTRKQIRNILIRQIVRISAIGIVLGSAIGLFAVLIVVPRLLANMYLRSYGEASQMMGFHPLLLVVAIIFSLIVVTVSTMGPLRKISKISAVEAVRYSENSTKSKRERRRSESGSKLSRLAWRNVFSNKRKSILAICSLFLSITVALTATVAVTGLDYTHAIEANPDLSVVHGEVYGAEIPYFDDNYAPLNTIVDEIVSIDGVKSYEIFYGSYVRLNYGDEAWRPLLKANRLLDGQARDEDGKKYIEIVKNEYIGGISIADDAALDSVEQYAVDNSIELDVDSVRNGNGAICCHFHVFSKEMQKEAGLTRDVSTGIYNLADEKIGDITMVGYLDTYAKGLDASIALPGRSREMPGLIVSEKTYKELGLNMKAFKIDINEVDPEKEPEIKQAFNLIIDNHLDRMEIKNDFEHFDKHQAIVKWIKSDALAEAQSYIIAMRIVMYSITALLLLMGIMNYCNVIATSFVTRKRDFAIMEALGMTRKQLRRMLITEGLYYSAIVTAMVVALGSLIMVGVGAFIKRDLPYFTFSYPGVELAIVIAAIFAFCILLPLSIYKRTVSESAIERLRYNG